MRYRNALARTALWLLTLLAVPACTPALVSSWTAPDATPFRLRGEKVAAVVMVTHETTRHAAEDALARQLSLHGAQGIPMYTLLPKAEPDNEAEARAAVEQAGVVGVVVMRPVSIEKNISSTPLTYSDPTYTEFWGGYYPYGWDSPWAPGAMYGGEMRTDMIVAVETLVYGLRENKLQWAGQSRTVSPRNVDRLIKDTAKQVTDELARLGLMTAN